MKSVPLFLLSAFVIMSVCARAQTTCESLFKPIITTESVIQQLAKLRLQLDLAQAEDDSSPHLLVLKEAYLKKEKELEAYFTTHKIMSRQDLREKIAQEIERLQVTKKQVVKAEEKEKKKVEIEISKFTIDGSRIVFHDVEPGEFLMLDKFNKKSVQTKISKKFQMSATFTTQIVWRTIVEAAQGRFPGRFDNLNADPSADKGSLHPVDMISSNDMDLWFEALNELSLEADPAVNKVISMHQPGDVYSPPSEAQWTFVATGRGTTPRNYYFKDPRNTSLSDYAWYSDNSGGHSHPVAMKLPIIIGNAEFFDMPGNANEFMNDSYDYNPLPGGTDPLVRVKNHQFRVTRGGSFVNADYVLAFPERGGYRADARNPGYSFRIVRNLRD